jgi:hypothetical protein
MRRDYDQLPKEIREQGMDFHWSNQKVWDLDIPVEELDIYELEWQLDLPFWSHDDGKYNLCPREVMEDMDKYPDHKERILRANISYPLDIMENQNGRLELLDGMHRLVRLIMNGQQRVKARKLSRELIPLIET